MAELRKEGEAPIQISDMELFDETQRIVKHKPNESELFGGGS